MSADARVAPDVSAPVVPVARVLHPDAMPVYAPAHHVNTHNRRIVGPDTVGARHMEVLLGTIAPGGQGLPHAHPELEQAGIVLGGSAESTLGGQTRTLRAGDVDFIPKHVFHSARVLGSVPLELLVIYAPPYLESPSARTSVQGAAAGDAAAEAPPALALPAVGSRACAPGQAVRSEPLVDAQRAGARHLRIDHLCVAEHAACAMPVLPGAERLLILRVGSAGVTSGGVQTSAAAGDWVFVPDGAACTLQADAAALDAILVTARSVPAEFD